MDYVSCSAVFNGNIVLMFGEANSFNAIYVVMSVIVIRKKHCLLEHIFYLFVTDHTLIC